MKTSALFIFQTFLLAVFWLTLAADGKAQSAGSLDTSFGNGGKIDTSLNQTATLRGIVVQPDGKTVIIGITFLPNAPGLTAFVARLNSNGTFDTTFDGDGLNNSGFMSDVFAVALQNDGKIVVCGFSGDGRLRVARFITDGSLDSSFNGNGVVSTTIGASPIAYSVNIQADGKILAVGTTVLNGNSDFALVRYNSDGSLDSSFGSGGRVVTNINSNDIAYESEIQFDGKIIAAGYSTDALSNTKLATIVRYNPDGSIDTTFGSAGKVIRSRETDSYFNTIDLQADGKIIVGGTGFPLSRYNGNGAFDVDFETGNTFAAALKFQSDGKILAAGGVNGGDESRFALVRYNANGTRDTTFGANGLILSDFNSRTYFGVAAFQPDGKVVGGGTESGNGFRIVLARYFTDFSNRRAVTDFDGDGKSDVSVFRPSNGAWYVQQSQNGFSGVQFGQQGDKLVPADYDGDGKTDVAVYRSGNWYLQRSGSGFTGLQFGDGNDIPMPGDFNGDGKAELAVFRPSNGYWYILNLTNNQFTATPFGVSGDKPVAADYDGDGKTDIAVNRNGNWYIQRSALGFVGTQFGDGNDKTVPADYDGDGKCDIAVFRPSNGVWYLLQSTVGFASIQFGLGSDIPVSADYDGDGKADIAVVRNGNWYLNRSTNGFTGIPFGTNTDLPIPNAFVK